MQLALASGKYHSHGGSGGSEHKLTLDSDEYWTKAKVCQGKHNDHTRSFYLLATTSAGNTVHAGTTTDDCQEFAAENGWQIVGFYGQDGDELDQLGFIYARI